MGTTPRQKLLRIVWEAEDPMTEEDLKAVANPMTIYNSKYDGMLVFPYGFARLTIKGMQSIKVEIPE